MDRREELIEKIKHETNCMSQQLKEYELFNEDICLDWYYNHLKNVELSIRKLMDEYE